MCLYLPRHYGAGAEPPPLQALRREARVEADRTALIVDDEPSVRGLVMDVLGDLGFHVLEASDGRTGLNLLQSEPIDLLITDVGLPGNPGARDDPPRRRCRMTSCLSAMRPFAQ